MKKILLITLITVFSIGSFVLNSFGAEEPQYGGVLRAIRPTFPKIIGLPSEMGVTDKLFGLPFAERVTNWDAEGNMVCELAESWDEDPVGETITFHLRKGVTFHDGSPLNADAVQWNLQIRLDHNRLPYGKYLKSMEVLDEHTIKIYAKDYHNELAFNYGWQQMYSKKAFETKGAEWLRKNGVGTGPFKFAEFQRDTMIKYVRNENYWQKGYPYLDGMEIRFIPDVMTAAAMMQAGQADSWMDVSDVQMILNLEEKGFKVNWAPGMFWAILPDSSDPNSPYADKRVREALEYAIDRPTLAKMLGYGKFEPLFQMANEASPAYVPGYNPRPYNPEKARQLLAEAGYPKGFETTLLAMSNNQDPAAALKAYLEAVGIKVRLDLADMGRYFTAIFQTGWDDLVFAANGIDPDGTEIFIHFGPEPMTYRSGDIKKSPEFLAACDDALHTYDKVQFIKKLKQVVIQGSEDAMIIPVYRSAQAYVMQPYVHDKYMRIHTIYWHPYDTWMEKH
jgi:peptide/nickel transport system substrate-binding protein